MTGALPLYLALAAYVVAGIAAAVTRARQTARLARTVSLISSVAGIALQTGFIIARAAATGFLPFASRFESMAIFALAVQLAGLLLFLAARRDAVKAGTDAMSALLLVGALMPVGFHPGGNLNPILNSPWFAFHILVAFAGYGCFTAGLVWSITHLFDRVLDLNPNVPRKLALAGLLLLGTGILTGAMWADSSWGVYWSWDPKESWSLLTWSVMMVYIHVSSGRPRRGLSAVFFGLDFLTMMFTFIGINLLRWGLHRY
jgi:ABC-type transport system involved in cytochrome c biogenesis permease subunit